MEQPFHDLEIFKEQTARNILRLSPDDKVSELVQADKDAEIVLMGLLKGHMLDLYEALSWQYASKEVRDCPLQYQNLAVRCGGQCPSLSFNHSIEYEAMSCRMACRTWRASEGVSLQVSTVIIFPHERLNWRGIGTRI